MADKYIGKDPFGNSIFYAESTHVEEFSEDVETVLVAIGFFMSELPVEWGQSVLVTDLSRVGDFGLDEQAVKNLGALLALEGVTEDSHIWELAKARLENRKANG